MVQNNETRSTNLLLFSITGSRILPRRTTQGKNDEAVTKRGRPETPVNGSHENIKVFHGSGRVGSGRVGSGRVG